MKFNELTADEQKAAIASYRRCHADALSRPLRDGETDEMVAECLIDYDYDFNHDGSVRCGPELHEPPSWYDIESETQQALLDWFNVKDPSYADMSALAKLYNDGKFSHGVCVVCGSPWQEGTPDNWDNFQGVNELDHMGNVCGECYSKAQRIMDCV
jgi:hypothetical protein